MLNMLIQVRNLALGAGSESAQGGDMALGKIGRMLASRGIPRQIDNGKMLFNGIAVALISTLTLMHQGQLLALGAAGKAC